MRTRLLAGLRAFGLVSGMAFAGPAAAAGGDLPAATAPASRAATRPAVDPAYALGFDSPTDPALQAKLAAIDIALRQQFGMTEAQTAVGVLDLAASPPRLALVRPDREEYAASVPKVGILLAYFEAHPEAVDHLDRATRHELGLMAKASNNEMAAKFSRQLGLANIQKVLTEKYGFYDAACGGGIWVGKHYGKDPERHPSPVGGNSHAATVRQLLRYWLLLEQGKLVSPAASAVMRDIFASPDIPHDDIKFVKGLKDRPGTEVVRKWGSWQDWYHDSAVVTGGGRHYVLVALTKHPKGDAYLEALAKRVDDAVREPGPRSE
jgi:beta-lactamase class A